jgi:hypothetical protein
MVVNLMLQTATKEFIFDLKERYVQNYKPFTNRYIDNVL